MIVEIGRIRPTEAAACEQILRALPTWFGIESAILDYRKDIEAMDTFVARDNDKPIGFVTVQQHFPASGEVQIMAVLPDYHQQGIGRQLMVSAETHLRTLGCHLIQVKTLGPSHPDTGYAKTRAFYQGVGYRPLEETDLWGKANPCLIMVKSLL